MELGELLEALPKDFKVGSKRNAKRHMQRWTGYRPHMDTIYKLPRTWEKPRMPGLSNVQFSE